MNILQLFDRSPIKVIYKDDSQPTPAWSLKANAVNSLMGENGIGKTSLIRELKKNKKCFSVSYLDQFPLKPLSHLSVEETITILSQGIPHFQLSEFQRLSEVFSLKNFSDKLVQYLSGGENQILKIMICLSIKAELYVLDEPFSFLSLKNQSILETLVQSISQTVLMIDHDRMRVSRLSQYHWELEYKDDQIYLCEKGAHV